MIPTLSRNLGVAPSVSYRVSSKGSPGQIVEDGALERELKRGRWGCFTVTPKQKEKAPPFGGYQARCVYHRLLL